MAMTEAEKAAARKERRKIQKAAKKAGMSTKEYRAQMAEASAQDEAVEQKTA